MTVVSKQDFDRAYDNFVDQIDELRTTLREAEAERDRLRASLREQRYGDIYRDLLDEIERLRALYPPSCEHHYVRQGKNTTAHIGPVECIHCGKVAHNTFPHPSR